MQILVFVSCSRQCSDARPHFVPCSYCSYTLVPLLSTSRLVSTCFDISANSSVIIDSLRERDGPFDFRVSRRSSIIHQHQQHLATATTATATIGRLFRETEKNWPRAKVDFSISIAASLPIVSFIYHSLFLADASCVISFFVSPSRFSRSALDTPGRCQMFIFDVGRGRALTLDFALPQSFGDEYPVAIG